MIEFNYKKFAEDIETFRYKEQMKLRKNLSFRDMENMTDVNASVIHGLLNGRSITLIPIMKLSKWANLNISDYVENN